MSKNDDLATKDLKKIIKIIIIIVVIAVLVLCTSVILIMNIFRISLFSISGDSMEPTFKDRNSVIIKQDKSVAHDQIVFFKKPSSWSDYAHDDTLVKRVIAVPGDVLSYDGKDFKVNNETVYNISKDNYECGQGDKNYSHVLTDKELFVMGDNALHSLDSRRIFCDGEEKNMYIPYRDVIDHGHVLFKF